MPYKGKSKLTPAQKSAVALGRAAGKTIPEIAKEVGRRGPDVHPADG
jgi:predicted transcriptional regulator